jgi:hypothetical protein
VPAGDLLEAEAEARVARELDRGEQLLRAPGGGEHRLEEVGGILGPAGVPGPQVQPSVQRDRDGRQFGGGIGVAQRPAEGGPV